jgi:drug/metabolite transporter (DMT)-like permease
MHRILLAVRRSYGAAPAAGRAALLIAVATLSLSAMQGCVRHLSQGLHPFEIGFFRSLFGCLAFAPLFLRQGFAPLRTRHLGLHAFRGVLHVISMLAFFLALAETPLAKAVALDFSGPLFAAVVAVAVLGERLRVRRVGALAVGYAGVLVVLRPGFVDIDAGALLVLGSAASWGLAMVIIKVLSRDDGSATIALYMVLFSTPLALLAALPFWTQPSAPELAWLLLTGALGSLGHVCIAEALRQAEMTAVVPLDFLRMVWSSIIGYVFFAEVPAVWTWIGGAMIFAAATTISVRESRLARDRRLGLDDRPPAIRPDRA